METKAEKMIATYRGRPITELSREELIKAIESAYHELFKLREECNSLRKFKILG